MLEKPEPGSQNLGVPASGVQNSELQNPELLQPFQEDDFLPPISRWMRGGAIAVIAVLAGMAGLAAVVEYDVTVQAPATVRPANDLTMAQAIAGGTLGRIAVQENQTVRKGDVIAELGAPDPGRITALQTRRNNLQQYLTQYQAQINQLDTQIQAMNSKIVVRANNPASPAPSPNPTASPPLEADVQAALAKLTPTAQAEVQQFNQERDRLWEQRRQLVAQVNLDQNSLQTVNNELNQLVIQSPVDGTILKLTVNTSGQAIRPGDAIAQIVPRNVPVVVKARVNTQDISQVAVGQDAQLRITAYPYPEYGTLKGTVQAISPDVVTAGDNSGASSSYEVTIQPARPYVGTADRPFPIQPGMEARADIITRRQTILRSLLQRMRLWSSF
jgi:multidrug efflux pump subunit AcrA (membrane-fusion protein)